MTNSQRALIVPTTANHRNPHEVSALPALSAGDIAAQCALPALDGRNVDIRADDIAGNPIVLLFCPSFSEAVAGALAGIVAAQSSFGAARARLFAITRDDAKAARALNIPFPVLLDREGAVFRAFDAEAQGIPTTVVLRPNQHVMAILKSPPSAQVHEALAHVERLAAERQSALMTHHPPVLLVPDVLSAADCRDLITIFRTRGQTFVPPGPGIDYIGTDYKMRIPEYGRADRIDHWIVDKSTESLLHNRIEQRLDGAPTLIVLDEAWAYLAHELFERRIGDWLRTMRRKNAKAWLILMVLSVPAANSAARTTRSGRRRWRNTTCHGPPECGPPSWGRCRYQS